jgi:hypothetical protein
MEQDNLKRGPQRVVTDASFLYNPCSQEELSDYEEGFSAGSKGHEIDGTKTTAWRRGWSEAQEYGLHFRWTA